MYKYYLRFLVLLCLWGIGVGSLWASETTLDFSQNEDFKLWDTKYKQRELVYPGVGTVTFASADKQNQTITDIPVTKGGEVVFKLAAGKTMTSVTLKCRQWGTKEQAITLHTSTDRGLNYTKTKFTSSNFTLIADSLGDGVNAVKFTFSSSSNQIGIASLTFADGAVDTRKAVNVTEFSIESATLLKREKYQTKVVNNQPDWSAKYLYATSDSDIVKVDADGVITALKKGDATITVTPVVADDDAEYRVGEGKEIKVTVVNPEHLATFYVNGKVYDAQTVVEEESIAFNAPDDKLIPEGWTFMGWSESEDVSNTKAATPTYVESATMSTDDVNYYAVFAQYHEIEGAKWKKVAVTDLSEEGTYAIITPDGFAFNGLNSSKYGTCTTTAFDFDKNGVATEAPEGAFEFVFKVKDSGYSIQKSDKYLQSGGNNGLYFGASEKSYWYLKDSNWNYKDAKRCLRSYERDGVWTFRLYKDYSGTSPISFAQKIPNSYYSDYCTVVNTKGDGRKEVNLVNFSWKESLTPLVKGVKLETVVENDQADWKPLYQFSSSDEKVVTIDSQGTVVAVGKGQATLTVALNIDPEDQQFKSGAVSVLTLDVEVVNPEYLATFRVNGEESTEFVEEGERVNFPEVEPIVAGLVFQGWTTEQLPEAVVAAPTLIDTLQTVMPDHAETYYAVFARVSTPGVARRDTLSAEEIRTHFNVPGKTYAYADSARSWQDGAVNWIVKGVVNQKDSSAVQVNSNNDKKQLSYLGFESANIISRIEFSVANGNVKAYNNSISIETAPENGQQVAYYSLSGATSFAADVEGQFNSLYIITGGTALIKDVILTSTTPAVYADYRTTFSEQTNEFALAECGYTTLCLPYSYKVSEGAQLFALTKVDAKGLHFRPVEVAQPNQGYLVSGAAGQSFQVAEAYDYEAETVNLLQGVTVRTFCSDLTLEGQGEFAYPWILAKDGLFKRYVGSAIPANKAYLDGALLSAFSAAEASSLRILLDAAEGDDVSAIDTLPAAVAEVVPVVYDLSGQRVRHTVRRGALYIVNGAKVIVK